MEVSWKQAANNCSWQARELQQGRSWKKLLIDNITCDEKLCESSIHPWSSSREAVCTKKTTTTMKKQNWKVCLLCCCWMLQLVCQFLILLVHYRKRSFNFVVDILRGLWRTISDSLLSWCCYFIPSILTWSFNLSLFFALNKNRLFATWKVSSCNSIMNFSSVVASLLSLAFRLSHSWVHPSIYGGFVIIK